MDGYLFCVFFYFGPYLLQASTTASTTASPSSTVSPTPSPRCDVDSKNYAKDGTAFASSFLPANEAINGFSGEGKSTGRNEHIYVNGHTCPFAPRVGKEN